MTITRQEVRDLCRRRLGDLSVSYDFSDLQVNQWINDAIADYNIHFPLVQQQTFSTTPGQNRYDLGAGVRHVLSVQYPLASEAPDLGNWLEQRDHRLAEFAWEEGAYDVDRQTDPQSEVVLWLSGSPDGSDCRCTVTVDHPYLAADVDPVSLPERHLELVMLYVRWAAYQELALSASADPDPTSLALSTLELNAYRAQRLYLTALQKIQQAESDSRLTPWKMDGWDRVY